MQSDKPAPGLVVVSVEHPSGHVVYEPWEDYVAHNFYVHRTLFGWVVRLWWRSLKRRFLGKRRADVVSVAEALGHTSQP